MGTAPSSGAVGPGVNVGLKGAKIPLETLPMAFDPLQFFCGLHCSGQPWRGLLPPLPSTNAKESASTVATPESIGWSWMLCGVNTCSLAFCSEVFEPITRSD